MASVTSSRTIATAVAAGLAVVAVLSFAAARASAPPQLPSVSADELVASVLQAVSRNGPVSGETTVRLDLGIPQVATGDLGAQAGGLASFFGDHRLKVWRSAEGLRVADILRVAERDLFVSKTDAWLWDSETMTARHLGPFETPSSGPSGFPFGNPTLLGAFVDPLPLARMGLQLIEPTTRVELADSRMVAGRPAYVLRLEPRTGHSLVGRVEIAIDSERRLPLSYAVHARGAQSPAISFEFTSVSFDAIDPSTFEFSPPPGATVEEADHGRDGLSGHESGGEGEAPDDREAPPVRFFGESWATVVALRVPSPELTEGGGAEASAAYALLEQVLPFSGPLFSARLVESGGSEWLLYGAVPQATLAAVASELS
ncbi:hypothetical protein BH20ACT24_BH20ACT24_03760 [soil metagenome]